MDIGLGVSRRLNLNHKVHVGNVKATRCDVGSDKHIELAFLESLEGNLALVLADVTMHDLNVFLDLVSENKLICISLSLGKDNSFA